jgi:PAS domain S-box-containing protein
LEAHGSAFDGAASGSGSLGQDGPALAVLDAFPDAMVAIDPSNLITYVNPRTVAIFGYGRDELVGQPVALLLPDAGPSIGAAPNATALGTGSEARGRRKDGTEFPVELGLAPLDLPAGPRVVVTIVDRTARKAAEYERLQAQKLDSIGRLAGGVAHDFNNVLFAIKGYAELLGDDLGLARRDRLNPDDALRSIDAINDAASRGATLTSQLLSFSQRQVVRPEVLDLETVVAGIDETTRPLLGAQVRLVLEPMSGAGRLRADRGQLDQILTGLVMNARDAMPGGGTIRIEAGTDELDAANALTHPEVEPGPHVFVSVSDSGPGMDAETRERIFEPFFSTKELGRGSGLGLATIHGIVRQAGGRIAVSSGPGSGSTFRLEFPRVDAPADVAAPSPAPTENASGTILVVEDESAVREMTSVVLRRSGYVVTAVNDGTEALRRLATATTPIDVLVTDVVMPGMSGIELAELVIERIPGAGIVLLSGYNPETLDLDRVVRRGALFLAKPVSSNDLLDAVKRSAERRLAAEGVT